jgi:hypothetical protein
VPECLSVDACLHETGDSSFASALTLLAPLAAPSSPGRIGGTLKGRCRDARPGRPDTGGFFDLPEGSIMAAVVPKRMTWLAATGIALRYLLLLAAFYAYVFLAVDTRLIDDRYISVSMRFSRTWDHFLTSLDQTGGLVAYAAGWLHQYYCYGALGAAILTLVAAALAAGLDLWMPVCRNSWLRLLSFLPAVGLLVAANYYDLKLPHPGGPLRYALGLLLALVAANVHARLPLRRLYLRIAAGLILAVLVYHAGGAFYSVSRGDGEAIGRIYFPGPLPIFIVFAVVRELWTFWLTAAGRHDAKAKTQAAARSTAAAVGVWLIQLIILLGLGATVVRATRQPDLRLSFQLDFCRHHGLWGEFLDAAARITPISSPMWPGSDRATPSVSIMTLTEPCIIKDASSTTCSPIPRRPAVCSWSIGPIAPRSSSGLRSNAMPPPSSNSAA